MLGVYSFSLFIFCTYCLFLKSCTHFLFPNHFMFNTNSLVYFFFTFSFSIKNSKQILSFFTKMSLYSFSVKMNTIKRYIHFFYSNSLFFYWKWKLSTNNKAKPIFEWWVSLKIENKNKMHHFFLLTKQPLRERERETKNKQNKTTPTRFASKLDLDLDLLRNLRQW